MASPSRSPDSPRGDSCRLFLNLHVCNDGFVRPVSMMHCEKVSNTGTSLWPELDSSGQLILSRMSCSAVSRGTSAISMRVSSSRLRTCDKTY